MTKVMGATDPSSGTASAHEVVRGLGALLRLGWKPLRTIVIASWDAEEVRPTDLKNFKSYSFNNNFHAYSMVSLAAQSGAKTLPTGLRSMSLHI